MRIKHFFGLAVLAAMTASCSSNNDLVNGGAMALVRLRMVLRMLHSRSICLQQQVVHVLMIQHQVHHHLNMVLLQSMRLRTVPSLSLTKTASLLKVPSLEP